MVLFARTTRSTRLTRAGTPFLEYVRRVFADLENVARQSDADPFDFHGVLGHLAAAPHDLDPFFKLLKRDGTMALVGAPATTNPSPQVFSLIMKRRGLAGPMIGGIPETQEMLDFCAEHGTVADIELIRADEINEAYERMLKGDVKHRFVIDSATLAV